jgi:hypothetical protein
MDNSKHLNVNINKSVATYTPKIETILNLNDPIFAEPPEEDLHLRLH